MEEAGLVVRSRDNEDRRLVSTKITAAGRRVVDQLDAPIGELHRRLVGHLTAKQLSDLIAASDPGAQFRIIRLAK